MNTVTELPSLPAVVDGTVAHRRRGQAAHSFRHTAYQWLVDLDEMPSMPLYLRPFAGFDPGDHLFGRVGSGSSGVPPRSTDVGTEVGADGSADGGSIKQNLLAFLRTGNIDLGAGARYVMLANARVFGHVFDPLSVFWCYDGDGRLRCLVAEVHNTYGQRHAYLLTPDAHGNALVDKQFYVSPFNDVSGRYRMHFEISRTRLAVRIGLVRDEHPDFEATFSGRVLPATRRTVARLVVRRPVMPQKVSVLIRLHGIRLWFKGLAVQRRPSAAADPVR